MPLFVLNKEEEHKPPVKKEVDAKTKEQPHQRCDCDYAGKIRIFIFQTRSKIYSDFIKKLPDYGAEYDDGAKYPKRQYSLNICLMAGAECYKFILRERRSNDISPKQFS